MKKAIANYCFIFGATALFFFLSNLVIAGAVFLFHGSESALQEWLSVGATVIFAFIISWRSFSPSRAIFSALFVIIALIAVFAGCLAFSKHFYDISYDGQTYQQEGVIQLANGWNPVYQNLDPAVIGADQKWIDYYPKGIWIVESYFYLIIHALQAAKALNLILVVVAAALVYAALIDAELLGFWGALVVSILAACNPVNIVQSLNFYVDGDLYSLFLCVVAIAISLYSKKRPLALLAFFSALVFFINTKFTSLVDIALVLAILFIIFIRQPDVKLFSNWLKISIGALAVGILFVGAAPYITNTIRYQAPFYPLFGKGSIDLKPYNVPGDYINKNSVEIFFLSFFAQSGQARGVGTSATYKLPFTYTDNELVAFRYPDPEEGGFGPLFGGILIVALLSFIFFWKPSFWNAGLIILFLILMCILDPISSLARYVPQAYLIAIIPVIVLLMLKKPFPVAAACVLIALLFFNNYLIAETYFSYEIKTTGEISGTLSSLAAQSDTTPILIHFNEFKSDRIMFQEAGINYVSVPNLADCPDPHLFLPENTTQLCS